MARRPQLEAFAEKHGLAIGTIADLIQYRLETEKTVERVSSHDVDTDFGAFRLHCYRDSIEDRLHMALVRGNPDPDEPFLVRVHVQNPLRDALSIHREDFGLPLRTAMSEIAAHDSGMLLVLGGYPDDDVLQRLVQQEPEPEVHKNGDDRRSQELRTYGVGAQIIADLGVRKMRVLSAPLRLGGLSGFGLEIVEYVDVEEGREDPS
jgi:3,4-dihydroxy 2-butanone 4-phosphate synthase/GTP cyclohydrolase II